MEKTRSVSVIRLLKIIRVWRTNKTTTYSGRPSLVTDWISVELGETDNPLTTSLRPFTNGTKAAKYRASVDALNLIKHERKKAIMMLKF